MSLYERFQETKEEGFREEFIKPLLIRMGFIGISQKHGSQEFGKDYVFSELDRFGKLRHMIAQAKHEKSINQGPKVDMLLSQIRQAFSVPYRLPIDPTTERHVSSVYVFNTGHITDNAQTQIRYGLPREHAVNAHFFDGAQLETLSNTLARQYDRFTRERIASLMIQCEFNIGHAQNVRSGIQRPHVDRVWDVRGFMLHGLESYLSQPLISDKDTLVRSVNVWQQTRIIEGIVQRHLVDFPFIRQETKEIDVATCIRLCDEAEESFRWLSDRLALALAELPAATV